MFKPLNDTLFCLPVVEESPHTDLSDEFKQLTAQFDAAIENNAHEFDMSKRAQVAQLDEPVFEFAQAYVIETGPDVRDVEVGDVVIVPPDHGAMITVVEDDFEYKRVFVIGEKFCLAKIDA